MIPFLFVALGVSVTSKNTTKNTRVFRKEVGQTGSTPNCTAQTLLSLLSMEFQGKTLLWEY